MHRSAPQATHILIVAPWGRDAESLTQLLTSDGYRASSYPTLAHAADMISDDTGLVLLTEEALSQSHQVLKEVLQRQPPWSDVPFIVLRSASMTRVISKPALPDEVINLIELERPIGSVSLISAVALAMRSRQKQFEIRDRLHELDASRSALAESESELRLITNALPVLIALVDTDLRYRFVNQAYEHWFGVSAQNVVGKSVEEIFGDVGWAERREGMARALKGESNQIEVYWPHADGRRREVEIRYIPRFDANGCVNGFHVFATDITERKVSLEAAQQAAATLERKVAERTAALETEMQARLESEAALRQSQKMEAVGQLTGGIAHDFNNMLTTILGVLDVMRLRISEGRLNNVERMLQAAITSAKRAAALTQRLLAFSRRQSLDPQPIEVNALVRSTHELLAQTMGERVRLSLTLKPDLPSVLVDANQLENALLNLCINARDAMPDGGDIRISTRTQRNGPRGHALPAEAGYVVLEVADTGVGIPPDVKERVFEPFFTTKPLGQGTGLGLSMIYGFMQQSKGTIDIQSKVGEGTTMSLYLPIAPKPSTADEQEVCKALPKGNGQRIVVVEDDDQVRFLVSHLLTELGYTVKEAREANGAMPLLHAHEDVDLLITDVGLPGLNGRQLAEMVREHHPSLPVLFMTGYAESAAIQSEFLGENMTLIAKPFDLDNFGEAVRRVLSTR